METSQLLARVIGPYMLIAGLGLFVAKDAYMKLLDDVTSSPRANRKASSGPNVAPTALASSELDVCRCVSPHRTMVGKARPA